MGRTLADFAKGMVLDVCNLLVAAPCPTPRDWHAFGGLLVLHGFGSPKLVGQDRSVHVVALRTFEDMLRLVCLVGRQGYLQATPRPVAMRLAARDVTPPRARTSAGATLADALRPAVLDACNRVVAAPTAAAAREVRDLLRDEGIAHQPVRGGLPHSVRVPEKAAFRRLLCKARPVLRLR